VTTGPANRGASRTATDAATADDLGRYQVTGRTRWLRDEDVASGDLVPAYLKPNADQVGSDATAIATAFRLR
jgi:hypothetical protein